MRKKMMWLLAAMMTAQVAVADEGTGTLYNLPTAVYQTLQAEGCRLPYEAL